MSFSVEAYVFSFIIIIFAGLFWWASTHAKPRSFSKFILSMISVTFLSLACFGVLTGLAFSVEYSNSAECENVINSTTVSGNTTTYTYEDSCSNSTTPKSLSMLYVAYNYLLLLIIFVAVFSLMFLGLTKVILKW